MEPEIPKNTRQTLQRLIRAFNPEQIILFGSYAKGTTHASSDVDFLVIVNLVGNPAIHRRRARQLTSDCFPSVDIVFASPEEVSTATTLKSPFLASILGRGKMVYSRIEPVSNKYLA